MESGMQQAMTGLNARQEKHNHPALGHNELRRSVQQRQGGWLPRPSTQTLGMADAPGGQRSMQESTRNNQQATGATLEGMQRDGHAGNRQSKPAAGQQARRHTSTRLC